METADTLQEDYMQQIVRGEKNYQFRRYLIASSVKRVWLYLNAPFSHIGYICGIDPARTRNVGDSPLTEDGLGNKEFNERHRDWDGYDFAYRIRSVYKLRSPIGLQEFKSHYGAKGAPRGLVYVPENVLKDVIWSDQDRLLPRENGNEKPETTPLLPSGRIHNGEYRKGETSLPAKRSRPAEDFTPAMDRKNKQVRLAFILHFCADLIWSSAGH
jgi:predicted transcriptional regulator